MGNKHAELIKDRLWAIRDEEYAVFQAKLTPTVPDELFIGCRVPQVRKLAKEIVKEGNYEEFINELPHKYYDENMLHGLLIAEIKDYELCIEKIDAFLPYIDNWAVCDTIHPKVFKKHRDDLIKRVKKWSKSKKVYECRFGIEVLMGEFLDEDYKPEYLEIPAKVKSEEYYINMMVAWYFATALAKQWETVIPFIENKRLSKWVHNKTIQKAIESYRITDEQKAYLRALKIK